MTKNVRQTSGRVTVRYYRARGIDSPMTPYDLEKLWITPEGIAGVDYRFGDVVRVNKPEHRDELYEVISLLEVTPQPQFVVVRMTDERSLGVLQEDLEPVGENTGRKLVQRPPGEKPNFNNA